MNKVTRGEKVLERLVDQESISRCGADWLIAAIDPFHDKQLANLQGWPDLESGSSVVRCIKQSITVTRPSTVPLGSNWDCHILMWPWLTAHSFAATTSRLNNLFTYSMPPPGIFNAVGGLQCIGMAAGEALSILGGGTSRNIGSLSIDNQFTQGAGRIVGMGFEVHNTTAQLYQQGAVAVYRQMALNRSPSLFSGQSIPAGSTYPFSGVPVRYPPNSLAQALLLQGTRQWEAREGCYVVAAFDDAENPAYPIQAMSPVILGSGQDDLEGSVSNAAFNYPIPATTLVSQQACPQIRVHPLHQSGAIFSGLSDVTSLVINWNVYYESFPALSQIEILPLASPSCEYDPDALDLFERILQELPVGVKVKENGLGDWFLGAINSAAKFLKPVIGGIHPIAGPVLRSVAGYLEDSTQQEIDRRKQNDAVPGNSWVNRGVPASSRSPKQKSIKKKAQASQKKQTVVVQAKGAKK